MERISGRGKFRAARTTVILAALFLLAGLAISRGLGNWIGEIPELVLAEVGTSRVGTAPSGQAQPGFVSLANRLKPVVVNISTTQVRETIQPFPGPFREEDPFAEFWRRFFGGPSPRGPRRATSLGSGFIIDGDGFILTNNHVVENADKILVRLSDRREFQAKVIGRDPKTDIAVIKIDSEEKLPAAALGDSNRLEVGEWVMAIGNPFGLDSTVTAGIVSAKGRHIGAGPYDDFIQTDASINPGNSGGPLINLQGEVVGINTVIFSQAGGNIGIGFAIPINLARELLPQLKETGKVVRGFLGVVIQRVTSDIAESLGMKTARGALVAEVSKDGPAERAGINVGDVIIEFDGKEIKESNDLPSVVARTQVNRKVVVKVLRGKKELALPVTVGELKEEEVVASVERKEELGLTVQTVTPKIAESLGLDRPEGVVITVVEPGSPADEAGLRRGDIILEVNRKSVRNLSDYRKVTEDTKKGEPILFLVRRGETTMFLALKL